MVNCLITVSLALLFMWGPVVLIFASLRVLAAFQSRQERGSYKRRASRSTSQRTPSTTALTARVAAYTSSSTEPGSVWAVRAIPRTLDALNRRIGPGFSTAATDTRGESGVPAVTAVSADLRAASLRFSASCPPPACVSERLWKGRSQ